MSGAETFPDLFALVGEALSTRPGKVDRSSHSAGAAKAAEPKSLGLGAVEGARASEAILGAAASADAAESETVAGTTDLGATDASATTADTDPAPSTATAYAFADACAEVSWMRVALLGSLPLPSTLHVELQAGPGGSPRSMHFVVTWSRQAYLAALEGRGAGAGGVLVLKGGELAALAVGAASGRGTEAQLRLWLGTKAADARFEIALGHTLAGLTKAAAAFGADGQGDISLGDALAAYGARVVAVGVGDDEGVGLVRWLGSIRKGG